MSGLLPPQQRTLGEKLPFSESVYLIAAALDPRFFLHWVDIDVQVPSTNAIASPAAIQDDIKESIKRKHIEKKKQINPN